MDFACSHVSHHALIDALGSDSTLAAVKTSLTPRAMTSRAASAVSLPLRASSAALCVVDGLFLGQKDRLDAGRFKALPAVLERSDFDNCHDN